MYRVSTCLCLASLLLPLGADETPLPEGYLPLEQATLFEVDASKLRAPGYLGVRLDATSVMMGCRVTSVVEGSSAKAAGIEPEDVIVRFDRIDTPNGTQLRQVVMSKVEGESIVAQLYRQGERLTIPITMKSVEGRLMLGVRMEEGVPVSDHGGLKVGEVYPETPAASSGLQSGDVIVGFDGIPTPDKETLGSLTQSLREGDSARLSVRRGEEELEISLTLAGRPQRRRRSEPETARDFKLAVVLVEFADVKHDERFSVEDFQTMFFSDDSYTETSPSGQTVYGSVVDFYQEISCGVFQLEGKVFDWVSVAPAKDDYLNQNMGRESGAFIQEALDAIQARDGEDALDGYEGLAVVYAGQLEHPRGRALWPHRSSVRFGRQRFPYYVMSELGSRRGGFSSIGTHCHEFGHMLGLPDQYSEVPGQGMELGIWCLMANGEDGATGRASGHMPLHPCPWCKIQVGWLQARMIDPRIPQKLALRPIEGSQDQCLKVPLREDGSEYLLLSYRGGEGFHKGLPSTGLMVWHVSRDSVIDLLEAHGRQDSETRLREVPFPRGSRTKLTIDADIADLKTAARGRWQIEISNIREQPGAWLALEIGPVAGEDD